VTVNFGPDWEIPPVNLEARAMSERWEEFREEERILDEKDEERDTERFKKEIADEEVRKKIAIETVAKLGNGNTPGGLAGRGGKGTRGKKRKNTGSDRGTSTPTPGPGRMSTPSVGDMKMEVESRGSTPHQIDRVETDDTLEAVKLEPGESSDMGVKEESRFGVSGDADAEGEDAEAGVTWE
jgi:hypothetical protein